MASEMYVGDDGVTIGVDVVCEGFTLAVVIVGGTPKISFLNDANMVFLSVSEFYKVDFRTLPNAGSYFGSIIWITRMNRREHERQTLFRHDESSFSR
jgi:hypothetical protein